MRTCDTCDKSRFCKSHDDPQYFDKCEYHSNGENIQSKDLSRKEFLIFAGLMILPIIPIYIFRDNIPTIISKDWTPIVITGIIWLLMMMGRILTRK